MVNTNGAIWARWVGLGITVVCIVSTIVWAFGAVTADCRSNAQEIIRVEHKTDTLQAMVTKQLEDAQKGRAELQAYMHVLDVQLQLILRDVREIKATVNKEQ